MRPPAFVKKPEPIKVIPASKASVTVGFNLTIKDKDRSSSPQTLLVDSRDGSKNGSKNGSKCPSPAPGVSAREEARNNKASKY